MPTTAKSANGSVLGTPQVTTFTYDADGNMLSEALPNGVTTSYTYDSMNCVQTIVSASGSGATQYSATYTYNNAGLKTAASEQYYDMTGLAPIATAWTYDADGRLASETVTSQWTDSHGSHNNGYADTYTYDLNSNRVGKTHVGPGDGASETVKYTYDGDDQLTSQTDTYTGSTTITTFTYDANGSELTANAAGSITTYIYDARNKMASVSNGTVTSYVYDDAGDRVQEQAGGGPITYYVTDTQNPTEYAQPIELRVLLTRVPRNSYVIGEQVLGQFIAGTGYWITADAGGSTRILTSTGGAVTGYFNYDAFGGIVDSFTSQAIIDEFGGDALFDPNSDLYLHGDGVRAAQGFRFLQRDTQGYVTSSNPVTGNLYLLDNGDTVNGHDPSGHYYGGLVGELAGDGWGASEDAQMNAKMAQAAQTAFAQVGSVMIGTTSEAILTGVVQTALSTGDGMLISVATEGFDAVAAAFADASTLAEAGAQAKLITTVTYTFNNVAMLIANSSRLMAWQLVRDLGATGGIAGLQALQKVVQNRLRFGGVDFNDANTLTGMQNMINGIISELQQNGAE